VLPDGRLIIYGGQGVDGSINSDAWVTTDGHRWTKTHETGVALSGYSVLIIGKTPYLVSSRGVVYRVESLGSTVLLTCISQGPAEARGHIRATLFNGEPFMMSSSSAWAAPDLKTWRPVGDQQLSVDINEGIELVCYDGRLMLFGQPSNQLMSSTDGVNWLTIETTIDGIRRGMRVIEHRGALYMLGGDAAGMLLNDTWVQVNDQSTITRHKFQLVGGTDGQVDAVDAVVTIGQGSVMCTVSAFSTMKRGAQIKLKGCLSPPTTLYFMCNVNGLARPMRLTVDGMITIDVGGNSEETLNVDWFTICY
jgi:hypothetical protein